MTPGEAADLMGRIIGAFPKQAIGKDTLKVYIEELADLPIDETTAAVREIVRSSVFFPAIAEIRSAVAERLTGLPSPEKAWDQVSRIASTIPAPGGTWGPRFEAEYRSLPDAVKEAIRAVGGLRGIEESEHQMGMRRDFMQFFESYRSEAVKAIQTGGYQIAAPGAVQFLPGEAR